MFRTLSMMRIFTFLVGLVLANGGLFAQVRDMSDRNPWPSSRNVISLPDDEEDDDEGADDLANGFTLATDKTTYDLCDTIEVTFTYRLDPPTSVMTGEGGGLGCTFLITLEDCAGNVLLDSDDLAGPIGCTDSVECSDEGTITRTVEVPLCGSGAQIGCGLYRVRAVTKYFRVHPDSTSECGPEAVIPVVVCDDSECPF